MARTGCGNAQGSWYSITDATDAATTAITAIIATNLAPGPSSCCPYRSCGVTNGPDMHTMWSVHLFGMYAASMLLGLSLCVSSLSAIPLLTDMLHCPIEFHLQYINSKLKLWRTSRQSRALNQCRTLEWLTWFANYVAGSVSMYGIYIISMLCPSVIKTLNPNPKPLGMPRS